MQAIAGIYPGEERYALAYLAHLAQAPGADGFVAPSTYGVTSARASKVRGRVRTLVAALNTKAAA